jgi:translation initiation factor IF-2
MNQQKIRINDLARELEVKSKAILDALLKVGVTAKKTHSSSVSLMEAGMLRDYFAQQGTRPATTRRSSPDTIRTKIDLSRISRPGDVLKAITAKVPASSHPQAANPLSHLVPSQPIYRRKTATIVGTIPTTTRRANQISPRQVVPPQSGTPPVSGSIRGSSSLETVPVMNEDTIEQAERLLRTLRAEEKKNRAL